MRRLVQCVVWILLWYVPTWAVDLVTVKERTVTQLAAGVYEIRHPDAPDTFPNSNTTVIIGERGVFVVDSCLLPSQAKLDIAQIKQWTNKPVLFVLNTHWHFDHTLGNATYLAAYPQAQIIAHRATAKLLRAWNPGAMARYPQREQRFKKILAEGKTPDGKPLSAEDRKEYETALAGLGSVIAEMKGTTQAMATMVFDQSLDVDLGGRQVQVRFLGRANTAGDTVVYLPAEKVIMTGDLVVSPVPYMFGGFPAEFPGTLDKLMSFDAQTIVPGHGRVMRDFDYVRQLRDMMNEANAEIEKEIDLGKTIDEVRQAAPEWELTKRWREKFSEGDAEAASSFDGSFAAMVTAAYNQLKAR
jgi:glyoxylase-like metal-dependent hydrolase (beta-lactamase superfamily II)